MGESYLVNTLVVVLGGLHHVPLPSGTWNMGSINEVSVPPIPLGYQAGPPYLTKQVCIEGVPTTKTLGEVAGANCVGAAGVLDLETVLVGGGTTPLNPTAGRRGAGAALDDAATPARCHPQGAGDIFGARWHKKKKGNRKRLQERVGPMPREASNSENVQVAAHYA